MITATKVDTTKKEYPELTFEQLVQFTKLLNQGLSEEEAYKEVTK